MVISVFKKILFSPNNGWNMLKEATLPSKHIVFQLLLPIVLIASLITFGGTFSLPESNIDLAFQYLGFTFFKWFSTVLISTWAINKLVGGFKGKKNFSNSLFIIVVSTLFPIFFLSLSHIFPQLSKPLLLLSLIGLIYYLFGFIALAQIPNERFVGFLLISSLIFAVNLLFMQLFWGAVFNIPFSL